MTEQEFTKLVHSNEQLNAMIQEWWDKIDDSTKGLINQMVIEQKTINQYLNNHLQVMILMIAQMKLGELFQETERRKRDD